MRPVEVQEMYRTLLETADHAICVLGGDGELVFANPACLNALGFGWEDLRGLSLAGLGSGSEDTGLGAALAQSRSSGMPSDPLEITLRHRDGTLIRARLRLAPLSDGNGSSAGTLAALTDVRG